MTRLYKFPRWAAIMYDRNASRSRGILSKAYETIIDDADVPRFINSGKILDIGCGPGHLSLMIAESSVNNDVTGVDYASAMVAIASRRAHEAGLVHRLHFKQGNVLSLPFPSESFDLIISSFSVHEWPSVDVAIGEVLRVMKTSGIALLFDAPPSIPKDAYRQLKTEVGWFDAYFMKTITGSCKATWMKIESFLKSIGEKVRFSFSPVSSYIQKLYIAKQKP
ncbi:MAG: class I SAM-dependent methyltransferase [Candidatus Sigynarchaeota archaeon]